MHNRILIGLVYIIVFFTGAAGLIYQVTWQKYLSRLMGSDSIATAMILAVFLGGLSLGYYLCGRMSTRIKNHFKAYAVMEGIIGAWCLFFPNLFHTVDSFTRTWSFSAPFLFIIQGFFCSVLLIGVPTVCMGGTIPFLTRGISKSLAEATKVHARVYAINTAGAFLGTLIAAFYLIPEYGLPLTVLGTAFVNLTACLSIYIMQKWIAIEMGENVKQVEYQKDNPPKPEASTPALSPFILYAVVFLSGFYVMTLENVFIRIINLSLGSSSYSFSLIVSVFILSIALGSFWVGRKNRISADFLFKNQLAITISLLLIYLTLDTWPYWAHLIRISIQSHIIGFWLYYACIFFILFLVLLVPAGLMGATVPIAFHEIKRDLRKVGKHSGYLFSLNTIGSLTGSLIGGIVFYYVFNNGSVFLVALSLACLSTYLAGFHLSKRYRILSVTIAIAVLFMFLPHLFYNSKNFAIGTFIFRTPLVFSLNGPVDFFKKLTLPFSVIFYKDGPLGTVSVTTTSTATAQGNQPGMAIFVNGKSDSNTINDMHTLKLSAHIPALLSKTRKNALIIGLGTGVTAGELSLYPEIESIDVAEISPTVVKTLPLFAGFTHHVHKNPKVHFHIADAFRFLGRGKIKYDIIISEPSNPWVTGVDLLFTEEFYRMVNDHLTNDGLFLQWVQFYAADKEMVGMVLNTVQRSFKYCHVFVANYGDLLILASNHDFSQQDLGMARQTFNGNPEVKQSLRPIQIENLESILVREVWTTSYLHSVFNGSGIQTMDNPRLHYIAGKNFFYGVMLPVNFIYNSNTARYSDEYLLSKLYGDWNNTHFSKEIHESLLRSLLFNNKNNIFLPVESIKIKAALDPLNAIKLNNQEKNNLLIDLIPFIEKYPHQEKTWKDLGLDNQTIRQKAQIMINHVRRFRDWIAPYSLTGLKSLLQEGIINNPKDTEKNWCSLQLILILIIEENDPPSAMQVYKNMIKDKNNEIILEKGDSYILKYIREKMKI